MDLFEKNWFEIIGLTITATEEMISKSIRKLSLKYHPDKNDSIEAKEIFLQIQKAKEILLDNEKRKAIIDHFANINKRKEYESKRLNTMNEQRKKFKENLEKKVNEEQTAKQPTTNTSFYDNNIDKVRKQNQQKKEEAKNNENKKQENFYDNYNNINNNYSIKIKWKRSHESHSDETLYQLFKKYGIINNIQLTGDKGNAAIITYNNKISCDKAIFDYSNSNNYKVTIYDETIKKKPNIFTHEYKNVNNRNVNINLNNITKNNVIYDEMKRAIERDLINKKLQEEDNFGSFDNEINTFKNIKSLNKNNNVNSNNNQIPFFNVNCKLTLDIFLEKEMKTMDRLKQMFQI